VVDAGAAACEQRAHDVVRNLLGGPMGRAVRVECRDADGRMQAVASVELPSWIPSLVPGWGFAVVGSATKEHAP
jgi:hypothetical protein